MKLRGFFYVLAIILCNLMSISNAWSKEISYSGKAAVIYASQHCGSPDPYSTTNGYNFSEYTCYNGDLPECRADHPDLEYTDKNGVKHYKHVDCANFVSQALIDGFEGKDWQIQWKKTTDWIGLNELQFIDSNIGWVGGEINEYSGDYILIYTTDGGKTWTEKEFKEIYHNRMIFLDKHQGVILTEKSHMLITKDGGKTWERKIQPIRKYPWHISEVFKEKDK